MASKAPGMMYIGVTAHLAARVDQHRRDVGSAFCRRYGIRMLVLAEWHDDIEVAIAREKALKAWKRDWKVRLIEASNSAWLDLYETLASFSQDPSLRWGDRGKTTVRFPPTPPPFHPAWSSTRCPLSPNHDSLHRQ